MRTTFAFIEPAVARRELELAARTVHQWAADEWIREFVEGISSGTAVDGSAQKRNAASTQRAKRRAGKDTASLKSSGKLAQRGLWRTKQRGRTGVVVLPPSGYEEILAILERRGYTVRGFSPEFRRKVEARADAAIAELDGRLQRRGKRVGGRR